MGDRGVVLSERGRVALEEIAVDDPGPGEVAIRIEATGVCHSDLHVIEQDGWGHPYPVLLGHEGAGTVETVGDGVDGLSVGDRVVIGWKTACGACGACRRGEPRQCSRPPAAAGRLHRAGGDVLTPVLRTGTFATRTVVPAVGGGPGPARAAGGAGMPDRLRRRDGRDERARDGEGLAGRPGGRDRVRRRRAVRHPGRTDRWRGRDPRDRPRRAEARAGAAVRRDRRGRGTGRLRLRRRRSARDVRARALARRRRRNGRPDRAFAERRRCRDRPAAALREADADRSSPTAATMSPIRTSRGSRSGRSRGSSTSRGCSLGRRRSTGGRRRSTR